MDTLPNNWEQAETEYNKNYDPHENKRCNICCTEMDDESHDYCDYCGGRE